jgi:subtilisin family serine protease
MIGRPSRPASRAKRLALTLALTALVSGTILPATTLAADPTASGDEVVNVIVTFKAKPGKAARDAVKEAGAKIRRDFNIISAISVELPASKVEKLKKHPLVKAVEPDAEIVALDHSGATGDLEYENSWGVEHIGTKPVHDAGIRGQGIKVAVIDTGIDYIHDDADDLPYNVDPEFLGNYRGGYDFFNNDADPMDDNGHGTHVAGILAAEHNGYLIVGVAPAVDLYGLKVLGANGSGEYSGLIAALDWAVANDMDVVNMSLGGHEVSTALQSAISAANAAGITLVAASGNTVTLQELINGCPVAYPAAYPEVIAVSFTGADDKLTGYSCTGTQVDLAAPGNAIFSTVPMGSCMFCMPQGYKSESGTSMASPHVAGVAALILSKGIANGGDPATLGDDVKAHMCATASPAAGMATTDLRYPKWYGCGIVDARQALLIVPPPSPVGLNHRPEAIDDAASTAEDTAVDVDVLANDSDLDGDALTVTAVGVPAFGTTAVNPTGGVHYVPNADANGTDTFGYTVDDGKGGTDAGTITVAVSPVNDPPTAVDDAIVTTRDTSSNIAVLANDIEPDVDPLFVASVSDPPNGSATLEADSSITYFPDPGYDGPDGFDYTASDGGGGTDVGHVSVTVTVDNHAPVAVADSLTTAEDATGSLDPAANDTDQDGGALVITSLTQPAHGVAELRPDGRVGYTPVPNYNGLDGFGYTITDGAGAVASGLVSVTITPVNDQPVAVDDSVTTLEDMPVNLAAAANDTDIDGDSLVVASIAQQGLGSAVVAAGGTITYTPPANYSGTDSFSYVASDGAGGSATGRVSVTIIAVDDPPTATPLSATTPYQTAITVMMTAGDAETCQLAFQIVTPPAHGTLGSPSSVQCQFLLAPYSDYWRVKYTPANGFAGVDTFTYRASDGISWSAPATVSITVTDPVLLHVGDLDRAKTTQTTTWTAKVTPRVDNASHAVVSGVTVSGIWSDGTAGSCKTSTAGTCTITKASIPKTTTVVSFTVSSLALQTGVYVASANHEADGDSDGTTIQVFGP